MRSLFVLIGTSLLIACGDRQRESPSANPLSPSDRAQVQRGQIVTAEGTAVSGAEVVIIDPERLRVLARAAADAHGRFVVSVPQRPRYWLGVAAPDMATHIDTAFAFTGEIITVDAAPRSYAAGKVLSAGRMLGDVNNDAKVDIADALLVLLYTLNRDSFVVPNQGDITLGDVDKDGEIDLADVLLIMTYVSNPLDQSSSVGLFLSDREVLIAFYEAMGGDDWTFLEAMGSNRVKKDTHWRSDAPLSEWYGVTTDNQGRVTGLRLSSNDLTGGIPESLGQLENLNILDLSLNHLTGGIPASLGQLKNLRILDLSSSGNALTGGIPASLGQLKNLRDLDLSNNALTGGIPASLGQLKNLHMLSLEGNALTGAIPASLGQLENLRKLYLTGNALTGGIPASLGQLKNLQTLELRDGNWATSENLTGGIPASLGQLKNLHTLDLSHHALTGEIPASLGQLANLRTLDLSDNGLTGGIPASLGQLANLRTLDLSDNGLTGEIPESLRQREDLYSLYLGNNDLTGCIPVALQAIPHNDLDELGLAFCGG